jgi:hypothetical protein
VLSSLEGEASVRVLRAIALPLLASVADSKKAMRDAAVAAFETIVTMNNTVPTADPALMAVMLSSCAEALSNPVSSLAAVMVVVVVVVVLLIYIASISTKIQFPYYYSNSSSSSPIYRWVDRSFCSGYPGTPRGRGCGATAPTWLLRWCYAYRIRWPRFALWPRAC